MHILLNKSFKKKINIEILSNNFGLRHFIIKADYLKLGSF